MAVLLFGATAGSGVACAAELPLWEVGVGATLLVIPDYRGSDEVRAYPLPFPYLVYRGEMLKVERERIRSLLFRTDRFLLDASLAGSVPVSSSNTAREGMPDLDPTFEIGPSLEVLLAGGPRDGYRMTLTFPGRAVLSTDFRSVRHVGWTFNPRLNFDKYDVFPGQGWDLGVSLGPMFANRSYHDYFYTVDPPFATPRRPAYAAEGGYSGAVWAASLRKGFSNVWVSAYVMVDVLHGTAFQDSPLVKRDISVLGGIAAAWVFQRSAARVSSDP